MSKISDTYKDLINVLDDYNISTSIVPVAEIDNRKEMNQYILSLDRQYYNISDRSKHFSGLSDYYQDNYYQLRQTNNKYKKTFSIPIHSEREKINIQKEINGLDDLLELIDENPLIDNVDYNINIQTLHNIKPSLLELNNMIGMKQLKTNVVDQIIYYIQQFHKTGGNDFMHTVIYGPPGTGKTEIAKIIGKIFSKLGILKKGTFRKVTRTDLIAGFLGQTALKTRDAINNSLGGVLFIDEAYALGNNEQRDTFAKECIDTLCEALSDNKEDLMVIIAGYEDELKTCFFDYNQGLNSRFTWRYKTDDYSYKELYKIFIKKVTDANWSISQKHPIKDKWFEPKMDYFKYYGRDMETLFSKTKICHSRRVFCKDNDTKTIITQTDLDKGFELYLNNNEVKNRKKNAVKFPFMYV